MKIFYLAEHIFAGAFFAVAYYLAFSKYRKTYLMSSECSYKMLSFHITLFNLLMYFNFLLVVQLDCDKEYSETANKNKELFRGIHGLSEYYDLVIVGAGLSGSVIAEQASKISGLRSLVIDKRDHIGGNCFDYIDEHGIRVS